MRYLMLLVTLLLGSSAFAAGPATAPAMQMRMPDRTITLKSDTQIHSLAFLPDSRSIYVHATLSGREGRRERAILQLDLPGGQIRRVVASPSPVQCGWHERMRFSPDGRCLLLFSDYPQTVHQLDAISGKLIRSYDMGEGSPGLGWEPAFSTDGAIVCFPGIVEKERDYIIAHDLSTGRQVARLALPDPPAGKARDRVRLFAQDKSILVLESIEGRPRLSRWQIPQDTVEPVCQVPTPVLAVYCSADPLPVSATATRLYVTTTAGLQVWDLASGREQQAIAPPSPGDLVFRIQATRDDRLLLADLLEGRWRDHRGLGVYDLKAGRWVGVLAAQAFGEGYRKSVGLLNLSPDGRTLLVVEPDDAEADEPTHHINLFDLSRYHATE